MNIRAKNGKPIQVKLLKQEVDYLTSCQGLMGLLGKTLAGDRLGKAAALAEENIRLVLELATAEPPKVMVAKENSK